MPPQCVEGWDEETRDRQGPKTVIDVAKHEDRPLDAQTARVRAERRQRQRRSRRETRHLGDLERGRAPEERSWKSRTDYSKKQYYL